MPYRLEERKEKSHLYYLKNKDKQLEARRHYMEELKKDPVRYRRWKAKRKASTDAYYYSHREEIQDKSRKRYVHSQCKKYGISFIKYLYTYKKQNKKCAICGSTSIGYRFKVKHKVRRLPLMIDHNHTTGEFRGLLCANCNLLIGHAKENVSTLRSAISYLLKKGTKHV